MKEVAWHKIIKLLGWSFFPGKNGFVACLRTLKCFLCTARVGVLISFLSTPHPVFATAAAEEWHPCLFLGTILLGCLWLCVPLPQDLGRCLWQWGVQEPREGLICNASLEHTEFNFTFQCCSWEVEYTKICLRQFCITQGDRFSWLYSDYFPTATLISTE